MKRLISITMALAGMAASLPFVESIVRTCISEGVRPYSCMVFGVILTINVGLICFYLVEWRATLEGGSDEDDCADQPYTMTGNIKTVTSPSGDKFYIMGEEEEDLYQKIKTRLIEEIKTEHGDRLK